MSEINRKEEIHVHRLADIQKKGTMMLVSLWLQIEAGIVTNHDFGYWTIIQLYG